MNKHVRQVVYHGNKILNQPLTIIIVLILLFIYFANANVQFQKQNRNILDDTHSTVQNSETIIKNLETAVADLKADNARQTRFIECILALHGANVQIDTDVQAQCEKMSTSVGLNDITKTQPFPQTQTPSSQPTTTSQPQTTQDNPPPVTTPPPSGTIQTILDGFKTGTKQIINGVKDIL